MRLSLSRSDRARCAPVRRLRYAEFEAEARTRIAVMARVVRKGPIERIGAIIGVGTRIDPRAPGEMARRHPAGAETARRAAPAGLAIVHVERRPGGQRTIAAIADAGPGAEPPLRPRSAALTLVIAGRNGRAYTEESQPGAGASRPGITKMRWFSRRTAWIFARAARWGFQYMQKIVCMWNRKPGRSHNHVAYRRSRRRHRRRFSRL